MKLSFFGAAHAVTGSCHCLEVNGRKILIDCGLQQGRDEHDDNALDFSPSYIDYVIVTHAHIDHSGRIPMLIKQGFQGKILTTRLTAELLDITHRLAEGRGYQLDESCNAPLLGYYQRRQAQDARTAGNGRLARNTLEKAIFHQSRRLVAEPAAALDVILPGDLELEEE